MLYSVIGDEIGTTFKEQIDTLNRSNIGLLELRKIDNRYLFEVSTKLLSSYYNSLKNIKISLIDSPIGKGKFNHKKEDKIFKKYINICRIFKCNKLRIFTDVSSLEKYNELAKRNNILLLVENEINTKGDSYLYLLEIMKKNYSNISLLFDVENYYCNGTNYIEAYKVLKPFVKYIHIRDYNIETKKYEVLFKGNINLETFLSLVDKEAVVSLETHLPMYYSNKEKCFLDCLRGIEIWKRSIMDV